MNVPQRATITNMGAELGATTSIFPSDEQTKKFLDAQDRGSDFTPLSSDDDALYDQIININLSELDPLIACPHSPDNVVKVNTLKDVKVDQVCIGSCTNSSLQDMLKVANILKGKTIADNVSLSISPGSKQVLKALANCGALSDILASGARVLECACGPCIGMGFSPNSAGVSLRTFNRNFLGRSGTKDANVYLVSPETAAASALSGHIDELSSYGNIPNIEMTKKFEIDDTSIMNPLPEDEAKSAKVLRGPNIKEFPKNNPLENKIEAKLTLKVEDNITTDHIMPAGAKVLPYRSNIPKMSEFCFGVIDEDFHTRAKENKSNIIIGGSNYGQGSSREHAALVPMYLGVKAVIAKSFARIHAANLINAGILPLEFSNEEDYKNLSQNDNLELNNIFESLKTGSFLIEDKSNNNKIQLKGTFTDRQREILLAGGLLAYTKKGGL